MRLHLLFIGLLLGVALSKFTFLPRQAQTIDDILPTKISCPAENTNVACNLCQAAEYYALPLKALAKFKPNASQLAITLLQSLSEAQLFLAQKDTKLCFFLDDVLTLSEGVSIFSLINNFFKVNFIEKYVAPFVKFEDFELDQLSFTYDYQLTDFYLHSVNFTSTKGLEISKYAALQELKFEYSGVTGIGSASGFLKVAPFYRRLEFSIVLNTTGPNGWDFNLNAGTDKLGDILTSFANFTENSPLSTVKDLLNDIPSKFDVTLVTKNLKLAIEKATLGLVKDNIDLEIIPKLLKIKSITSLFSLFSLEFKVPDFGFTQTCDFRLSESWEFNGTISRSATGDNFLKVLVNKMNVTQVVTDQVLPTGLSPYLQKLGLDNIVLFEGAVRVDWGPSAKAVGFSGRVSYPVFETISFDFIAFRDALGTNSLTLGVSLPITGLVSLINNFFPVPDLQNIVSTFYGSDIAVMLGYNKVDFTFIPEFRPSYTAFLDYFSEKLDTGLTVYSEIRFANDRLEVGRFLRKFFGEKSYLLKINLQLTSLSASVSVTDIALEGGYVLSEVGVFFTAGLGAQLEFGVRGKLTIPTISNDRKNLSLVGSLSFIPGAIKMGFELRELWKSVLGVERLTLGNGLLSGSLSFAGVPSGVKIGGQIAVGKDCFYEDKFIGEGYCIGARGYVGVDGFEPKNNFVYLNVPNLNFDILLRALLGSKTEQPVETPEVLNQAFNLPEGLLFSYALLPQVISGNLNIPEGFRMKGRVDFFNATGDVDINYSLHAMQVLAHITLTPINFYNIITIDSFVPGTGLQVDIEARLLPPVVNVNISGYVSVLGIVAKTNVLMDKKRLFFYVTGNVKGGLFAADLTVQASYSDLKSAFFNVSANLKIDDTMGELVKKVCKLVGDELLNAKAKLQEARDNLTKSQEEVDKQKALVCSSIDEKCTRNTTCNVSQETCKEYGKKIVCDKTEESCTGGWEDTCVKTEQKCSKSVPSWLGWACFAWSTVCTQTSKVCKGITTVCALSRQVVDFSNCIAKEQICIGFNKAIDLSCKGACEASKLALTTAIGGLEGAKQILWGTEKGLSALAKGAELMGENYSKVFQIEKAGFTITLNAETRNFMVDFSVNILGYNYSFSQEILFSDLVATAKILAEIVKQKISSAFSDS